MLLEIAYSTKKIRDVTTKLTKHKQTNVSPSRQSTGRQMKFQADKKQAYKWKSDHWIFLEIYFLVFYRTPSSNRL